MKFIASRLSEGNKIFPAEIHCEQNGLTVKIPGLFGGHSKHIPYNQIGEVSVDAPLVGYSTINFYTAGTRVTAHGFTSSEVKQIKSIIEKSQFGQSYSNIDNNQSPTTEVDLLETQLYHEKEIIREKHKHELKIANLQAASEELNKINTLEFGADNSTLESIAKQLEFYIITASYALSETFNNIKSSSDEREKYNQSEKLTNASIKKAQLGLNRLRLCDPQDKSLNYYNLYNEQINEVRIKQINRNWEIKIQQTKPEIWVWIMCLVFLPAYVYPIFQTVNATMLMPKKRDAEISKIKQL